jgi:Protein of unknown function (DUF3099)
VKRSRKPAPVLITDAPPDPDKELRWREIRYLIMMTTRALCLIGAAVLVTVRPPLVGLWLALCVIGTVLLPWLAVILANDRRAKPRALRGKPTPPASRAVSALDASPAEQIIDAEVSGHPGRGSAPPA